eukprot:CAMPEP_0194222498 /NCGR_PEP_ID=MMETSP0156-20130528/33096_1 /TAXON_ID=33649 /ORGANISM="Thalassionema nitzschioides, Strain L26-B" /LENGTH=208 /DNA_ID=CAMNT_0038953303 /DNA_START=11 /DNA_END=634 /DNA_ORIENTATION=+
MIRTTNLSPSEMIQVEGILEENNMGIEHLSSGRYMTAKKAFRSAILKLREFYQQQQRNKDYAIFYSLIIEPKSIPRSPKMKAQSKTHYIYRNALLASIDKNPPREQDRTNHFCTDLTAILIFNLCLVYHCSTEQYERKLEKTKVLRMYKKAWDSLKKDSLHHDTIALGILNNMGALFHDLAKYQQAQHCFKALKSAVSSKSSVVQTLN